jgi:cysteinyl-tRNA synthetase
LSDALLLLDKLTPSDQSSFDVPELIQSFYSAMDDDFNAPTLIANLFEGVRRINLVNDGKEQLMVNDIAELKNAMFGFVEHVLGLQIGIANSDAKLAPVMELVLDLRQHARTNKDWTTSDRIRDGLAAAGITIKDSKEGTSWS